MTEQTKSDTPIYDELMAARATRAAEKIVDQAPLPTPALAARALQETTVVTQPEVLTTPEKKTRKLLSLNGYSAGARSVIETINNAILDGEYTVRGRAFVDYVNDHKPYVTSHEFTKLQSEVRAL